MPNFSVYTRGRRWHQELYAKNMQNKENKQSSHFVIQCNGFNISYFSVFSYVLAWEKKSRNLSTGEQASSVGRGSKDVLTMMTDRDKSRRGKIKWGVVETLAAEFAPIMFLHWQLLSEIQFLSRILSSPKIPKLSLLQFVHNSIRLSQLSVIMKVPNLSIRIWKCL